MEKGGGMGACGVEMMQVDYIFQGENLKYIRSYGTSQRALSTSAIHARLAEWPRPVAGSRSGIPRSRPHGDPDQLQARHGPIYINFLPLSPSSLSSSLAPLLQQKACHVPHITPDLPRASGCYDHWWSPVNSGCSFPPGPYTRTYQ